MSLQVWLGLGTIPPSEGTSFQREEELLQGDREGSGLLGVGQHDPVIADLDFGDVGHAVLGAAIDLQTT